MIQLPYEHIQTVMTSHDVNMGWKDEDSDWAAIPAFQAFSQLPAPELEKIPGELLAPIVKRLQEEVLKLLEDKPRAIATLDLELTTNRGEYVRVEAQSLADAKALLGSLDLDDLLDRQACYFDLATKTAKRA